MVRTGRIPSRDEKLARGKRFMVQSSRCRAGGGRGCPQMKAGGKGCVSPDAGPSWGGLLWLTCAGVVHAPYRYRLGQCGGGGESERKGGGGDE